MNERVTIFFEHPIGELNVAGIESISAVADEMGYKIASIPFYAMNFAFGDIVAVEQRDDGLYAQNLIKASGHSTVRIWLADHTDAPATQTTLEAMGCRTDIGRLPRLVAVDIAPNISYKIIKNHLDMIEESGKWDYEEACLGFLQI